MNEPIIEEIKAAFPGAKELKKPDPRHAELTKFWCEIAWREKYGYLSPWGGKEAKGLQRFIGYLDRHDATRTTEIAKATLSRYLSDKDGFYVRDKHPFSSFAAKFQKWLPEAPKKASNLPQVRRSESTPRQPMTEFEIAQKIAERPILYLKGFVRTGPIMQKASPRLYGIMRQTIVDLVGLETARSVWKHEKQKIASGHA